MLMHLCQKSLSFIINKCHRAYHDSNGSVRVSGLSPTVFQLLNPSTCEPAFKLEDCPYRIGSSNDFQHGFTSDLEAQQVIPGSELRRLVSLGPKVRSQRDIRNRSHHSPTVR